MKKRLKYYLFLSLFILLAQCEMLYASHIYGGDLLYEHISGNSYKVILTIYGDCSGRAFPALDTAVPSMIVKDGSNDVIVTVLSLEPGAMEVTPVCPDDSANTACKSGNRTLPGIFRYVYSTEVTLPYLSANWVFVFNGTMGGTLSGRSDAIGNIIQPTDGSLMYLEAKLNNTVGPNSSPKYTTIPTPFFCVNIQQEYNQGAVDPNNDSLRFLLTAGLEPNGGFGTKEVIYRPPYKATAPLATATGAFSYNELNGQMSFTPNAVQISLVNNTIEEYKNGVLVGTSMREMTFMVLANCDNTPPVGKIDSNVVGGVAAPGNTVNVCQGTEKVAFTVSPNDGDADVITVTSTGIPFGGVLTIKDNNTSKPKIDFSWNPTFDQALGVYTFFLNYKDDGCPLSSNQTVAYTINVVRPLQFSYRTLFPTECAHNAFLELTVTGGAKPRIVEVYRNNTLVQSYSDSNNSSADSVYIITDSFRKGNYDLKIYSPYLKCNTTGQVIVPDSGTYPYPPIYDDLHTCVNAPVTPIRLQIDTTIFTLNWYDTSGTKLVDPPPVYRTDSVKRYTWQISRTHLVCESKKVDLDLYVHAPPEAVILNKPVKVCLGDEIYLVAAGGDTYTWLPADKIYYNRQGQIYTRVMAPTTYSVVAQSEYGCLDTADITYNDIENCCTFSYPNAFTPNGDGRNDRFKALFYGNASEYRLSVFNRWGQQVYTTNFAFEGWDGTFNGKPCDEGVYFYRVKATCITGHKEDTAGDFTLIR